LVPGFDVKRISERCGLDRDALASTAGSCRNLVEFADLFYGEVLSKTGTKRWVDKAPWNVRVVADLLRWYPRGRFIHVIRDGRDVACSLRTHPKEVLKNGEIRPVTTDNPIEQCTRMWCDEVSRALPYCNHPRYFEMRYEELVSKPKKAVTLLCEFIGERFERNMLQPRTDDEPWRLPARLLNNHEAAGPIRDSRIGRWRTEMSALERKTFRNIAGELLLSLGYVSDETWIND
jgi:hypothetical protein